MAAIGDRLAVFVGRLGVDPGKDEACQEERYEAHRPHPVEGIALSWRRDLTTFLPDYTSPALHPGVLSDE